MFFGKSGPPLGVVERVTKAKRVGEERQVGVHCHFAVTIVLLKYVLRLIFLVWHIKGWI